MFWKCFAVAALCLAGWGISQGFVASYHAAIAPAPTTVRLEQDVEIDGHPMKLIIEASDIYRVFDVSHQSLQRIEAANHRGDKRT